MRCHTAKNPAEREPPLVIDNSSEKQRRLGYCLLENPKKSWKFLDQEENAQENPCLVCDKRFRLMRALFCHMKKIHSIKDDKRGDWCEDRGKGSSLTKSCWDHTRPIHDRERLNLSILNEDRLVGSSKTKSDLLLIVLSEDEAMHLTRRKRTRQIAYDVDQRTEGVLFSVPDGSSSTMMSRGKMHFKSPGLGVETLGKSSALDFFDAGKGRITEASECNESHLIGYSRMEQKRVEVEVPTSMLYGAREVEHKKPKAARSGEEPRYEAVMMDCDAMGTAGSVSRERAELWIEPGLNSYRDKVCAEESQVLKYKSRDAESYKQKAPVDASHRIEGSHSCTELKSIKDNLEKANRQDEDCRVSGKSTSNTNSYVKLHRHRSMNLHMKQNSSNAVQTAPEASTIPRENDSGKLSSLLDLPSNLASTLHLDSRAN